MSMNYEEFIQEVTEHIKDFIPEKYSDVVVTMQKVIKNNDTELDGMVVRRPDEAIAPTVYLNAFYEEYLEGSTIGDTLMKIGKVVTKGLESRPDASEVLDRMSFEKAKGNIFPKLLNKEHNEQLLSDRPHTEVADLVVTYHVPVELSSAPTGYASSIPITDEVLSMYGISVEELHEMAMKNLQQKEDFKIEDIRDIIKRMMIRDMVGEDGEVTPELEAMVDNIVPVGKTSMLVVSNDNHLFGANQALNESAMNAVKETLGEGFIIIPSSIHEVIVVPHLDDPAEIEAIVRSVNSEMGDEDEILSNGVYEYDFNSHQLVRIGGEGQVESEEDDEDESIDVGESNNISM